MDAVVDAEMQDESNGYIQFNSLPPEIIESIFLCLKWRQILKITSVCKLWNSIISSDFLWKTLFCKKNFVEPIYVDISDPISCVNVNSSWKSVFKQWNRLYQIPSLYPSKEFYNVTSPSGWKYFDGNDSKQQTAFNALALRSSNLPMVKLKCEFLKNEKSKERIFKCVSSQFEEQYHHLVQFTSVAYYEIILLPHDSQNQSPRGFPPAIGMGVSYGKKVILYDRQFPGWAKGSVGYHSDDGRVFYNGAKTPENERWGPGDIVGCGVDCATNEIFFTKNGKLIQKITSDTVTLAFENTPCWNVVAMVSIDAPYKLFVNFGDKPFLFDPYVPLQDIPTIQVAKPNYGGFAPFRAIDLINFDGLSENEESDEEYSDVSEGDEESLSDVVPE